MNIVITDCLYNEFDALNGVCRENFKLHNYVIVKCNNHPYPTPLSAMEMEGYLSEKILHIQNSLDSKNVVIESEPGDTVWFCTLKTGFLLMNKGWMFYAAAVFRKQHDVWFTGQTEACALRKGLWGFIELPEDERSQKFKEFDNMLEFQPLSYYTNGISEVDWYKQAFRNCIPIAIRS